MKQATIQNLVLTPQILQKIPFRCQKHISDNICFILKKHLEMKFKHFMVEISVTFVISDLQILERKQLRLENSKLLPGNYPLQNNAKDGSCREKIPLAISFVYELLPLAQIKIKNGTKLLYPSFAEQSLCLLVLIQKHLISGSFNKKTYFIIL